MKRTAVSVFFAGLLVLGPAAISQQALQAGQARMISFDVAMDAQTWRMDSGDNPFFPTVTGNVVRGDTFIVTGKIYPVRTLPDGFDTVGPDRPGSIGKWVCRGTFNLDWEDIVNGEVPHVTSTQYYYFDDGSALISDGQEGGVPVQRVITGGSGPLAGAAGDMIETPIGVNNTNLFNLRFTVRLAKRIPPIARLSAVTSAGGDAAVQVISNIKHEDSGTFFNNCTQENMEFHGVMHLLVTEITDAAGGKHYHFRYTFGPVTNVGLTTGTIYHAQSNFDFREATPGESGVYQTTITFNRPFAGEGTASKWTLHYSVHVTVTPDGVTVSDPENFFVTCM
jgi:hypothetical protein